MSLIDQLTTAIAAKEAKAQAATEGPWTACQQYEDGPVGVDVVPPDRTGAYIVCPDLNAGMIAEDAEFVADNAPASVLALCQAHREIVDEYLRVLKDRKERHGDLGLAGALLALHGVVGIVARGYGITEEDTCD